jgi:hypothetical protein
VKLLVFVDLIDKQGNVCLPDAAVAMLEVSTLTFSSTSVLKPFASTVMR